MPKHMSTEATPGSSSRSPRNSLTLPASPARFIPHTAGMEDWKAELHPDSNSSRQGTDTPRLPREPWSGIDIRFEYESIPSEGVHNFLGMEFLFWAALLGLNFVFALL